MSVQSAKIAQIMSALRAVLLAAAPQALTVKLTRIVLKGNALFHPGLARIMTLMLI